MEVKTIGGLRTLIVGDKSKPMIVLFHGYGSSADDLAPLHQIAPKDFCWVFPEGPLKISFGGGQTGSAWFPVNFELIVNQLNRDNDTAFEQGFPPDLEEVREKIERFLLALEVKPSRLIIGGFSQGGIVAMEIGLSISEKIGGLIILSSTLIHGEKLKELAKFHANLPFFQSHGTDDGILSYKRAVELHTLLTQAGLVGTLHTFHGGHEVPYSVVTQLKGFLEKLVIQSEDKQ